MGRRILSLAGSSLRFRIAVFAAVEAAVLVCILAVVVLVDMSLGGRMGTAAFALLAVLLAGGGVLVAWIGAGWAESPAKEALGRLRIAIEAEAAGMDNGASKTRSALDGIEKLLEDLSSSLADAGGRLRETEAALEPAAERLSSAQALLQSSATAQLKQARDVRALAQGTGDVLKRVIQHAEDGLKTATLAVENAKSGGDVVNQTVKHMNAITITVANSAKIIRELGERSKGIGEIIRVIDDIADQTNLLALNAAIEAARAGEQGRGFAVVADEVRKLAERTTIATKEIASTIRSIQAETTSAVAAMDEGIKEVDKGAGLAVQAGVWLQKIVGGARKTADMISKIANSPDVQKTAEGNLSEEIARLAKSAEENLERVREARVAVESLREGMRGLGGTSKGLPDPGALGSAAARAREARDGLPPESALHKLARMFEIE